MSNRNRKLVDAPYDGQTTKVEDRKVSVKKILTNVGKVVVCAGILWFVLEQTDCNCYTCGGRTKINNEKDNDDNDLDVSGNEAENLEDIESVIDDWANKIVKSDSNKQSATQKQNTNSNSSIDDLANKIVESGISDVSEVVETNLTISDTLIEDAKNWKKQLEEQEKDSEKKDDEEDSNELEENDNNINTNTSNSNKPSSTSKPNGGNSSDLNKENSSNNSTTTSDPTATPTPPPVSTPTPTPPPVSTPTPTPPPVSTPTPTPPPVSTPTPNPDKIDSGTSDGNSQTDIGAGEEDEIKFPSADSNSMNSTQPSVETNPNDVNQVQDEIVFPFSSGDANDISSRKNALMELKMFCQGVATYQFTENYSMIKTVEDVDLYTVKSYHA